MRRRTKPKYTKHTAEHPATEHHTIKLLEVDESNRLDDLVAGEKVGQELVGISDGQLRMLYDTACQLLDAQECERAARGFSLLCQLHPYIADFWLGLAQARRLSGEPEQAVSALLMAETMDTHRADVTAALVETYIELGDIAAAKKVLQRARRHSHDQGMTQIEKHSIKKEIERLEHIIKRAK